MTTQHIPPQWTFEFHGHQCPFMPIGYRMGRLALEKLGVEREKDHGFFVFPELGEAHPQTYLMDGIQPATGATYDKLLIAKTFYGKLAATFYQPQKGGVRYSLKPDAVDAMGKFEFLAYRRKELSRPRFPRR
jgi:formylmethanofuran dehydrogenase subunit E